MSWIRVVAIVVALAGTASAAGVERPRTGAVPSPMTVRALRLGPGADLGKALSRFARENRLRAGVVLTCVGSLSRVVLRLADQAEGTTFDGKHEIVSMVGTLSPDGDHIHLAVSDATGRTVGGHLMEGSIVYTTAEIVVGEIDGLAFARVNDPRTTYDELAIRKR
jgi:predicted DNA-binding protein with PD1-like motif